MYDLLFKNVQVVRPHETLELDVGVRGGKIEKIAKKIDKEAVIAVDGEGKHLLPGGIDMHVHFRDLDKGAAKSAEDFATGSRAAAAGGFTSVILMPNTDPATTTLDVLERRRGRASMESIVNYGFYLGLTRDNLEQITQAVNIAGVKLYMGSTTGDLLMTSQEAIEEFLKLGIFTIVHAEDEHMLRETARNYTGKIEPAMHSRVRPPEAAYEAVKHILHLAKKHEARVHITHVSTATEISEIAKFKSGKNVSCDVTPHHLFLNTDAYKERGNFVKMNPPLRLEKDQQGLWQGIKDRIVDAVASDHAPHLSEAKEKPYEEAPSGVPGLETTLPLLLDAANHGQMNIGEVAWLVAQGPAVLLKIQNKGQIEEGFDADLTLVDMKLQREVEDKKLFTKCGWSPFSGWKLMGWPVMTVVNGTIVYRDGAMVGAELGKELQFGG